MYWNFLFTCLQQKPYQVCLSLQNFRRLHLNKLKIFYIISHFHKQLNFELFKDFINVMDMFFNMCEEEEDVVHVN